MKVQDFEDAYVSRDHLDLRLCSVIKELIIRLRQGKQRKPGYRGK